MSSSIPLTWHFGRMAGSGQETTILSVQVAGLPGSLTTIGSGVEPSVYTSKGSGLVGLVMGVLLRVGRQEMPVAVGLGHPAARRPGAANPRAAWAAPRE